MDDRVVTVQVHIAPFASIGMRYLDLGNGWHIYMREVDFLGERIAALTDPELAHEQIDFDTYALVSGAYKLRDMEGAPQWRI